MGRVTHFRGAKMSDALRKVFVAVVTEKKLEKTDVRNEKRRSDLLKKTGRTKSVR